MQIQGDQISHVFTLKSFMNFLWKFIRLPKHKKEWCIFFNPNIFVGLVGKVQKKLSRRRKEGKVEKKKRPPDLGLEPGTCRVLGEGPQLHARGAV